MFFFRFYLIIERHRKLFGPEREEKCFSKMEISTTEICFRTLSSVWFIVDRIVLGRVTNQSMFANLFSLGMWGMKVHFYSPQEWTIQFLKWYLIILQLPININNRNCITIVYVMWIYSVCIYLFFSNNIFIYWIVLFLIIRTYFKWIDDFKNPSTKLNFQKAQKTAYHVYYFFHS